MKGVLFILWMSLISSSLSAQDFASRYLENHKPDDKLTWVTVSPKMIEKVMKLDVNGDDQATMDIISKLKSMQLLSKKENGRKHYEEALEILDKNANRFEPYLSYTSKEMDLQIMVRKKRKVIIELVMLICEDENFTVINFTGNMSGDFITKLAKSVSPKAHN